MSDIPISCYDSLNKKYKCIKCGFCVSYSMGNRSFNRFKNHFKSCNESKYNIEDNESNCKCGLFKVNS